VSGSHTIRQTHPVGLR